MKLQQVNLMRHQRRPSGAWGIGRMLRWGGMLVAVLVMFSVANWWYLGYVERDIENLKQRQLDALAQIEAQQVRDGVSPEVEALNEQVKRLQSDRDRKREVVARLRRGGFGNLSGFSHYLKALAEQRIDGLWLTRLQFAEGGADIQIEGKAWSPEQVPELLGVLGTKAAFSGTEFRHIAVQLPDDGRRDTVRFELATDKPAGARR